MTLSTETVRYADVDLGDIDAAMARFPGTIRHSVNTDIRNKMYWADCPIKEVERGALDKGSAFYLYHTARAAIRPLEQDFDVTPLIERLKAVQSQYFLAYARKYFRLLANGIGFPNQALGAAHTERLLEMVTDPTLGNEVAEIRGKLTCYKGDNLNYFETPASIDEYLK